MTNKKNKSEKEDNSLKKELEECKKLKDEYLDSWKRERASFLNYKKEGSKRIEVFSEYIKTSMILKFIPILDNFNLAEKEIPEDLKKDENVKGLLQIKKQIQDLLKNEGVSEIKCLKEEFDPNFHDVVESIETKDEKSGIIVEEVRKGYKINGKLLRAAKVKIVK